MEEDKLKEIIDSKLEADEKDERVVTAMKVVALWCIQEDMHLRPAMTKVVQMLEGHCAVPQPPTSSYLDALIQVSGNGGSRSEYFYTNNG